MSPKRALRQTIRWKRDLLSEAERAQKTLEIETKLLELPKFRQARVILFYASFGSEVPTQNLMEDALRMGKRVVLPITDTETKRLLLREVHDVSALKKNKYGIPEPTQEDSRDIEQDLIDLIIVPGVAFDVCGHRIGYGGGYYDRFLKTISPSVPRISLAFEIQIVPEIPKEDHDLPVDEIVTEKRIIDACKARSSE
ncbi:MAG: 5-formyltetrahydrofolate cyclo-ligase [Firmicutes bacterium]|nr:5-formyltetrahydrofolate cyclo-ligase [Bacillota bacterium]